MFQKHLRPGETIAFQTGRRLLPRGWGADLTIVSAFGLGMLVVDEHLRAITTYEPWEHDIRIFLILLLAFRVFRHLSDLRILTIVTEQRLLNVRQVPLPGWPMSVATEIELSEITAVFAHRYQLVVETNGDRTQKLEIPARTKALAAWLVGSHRIEAVMTIPTRLESIARFASVHLPAFIGMLVVPQLMVWILALIPEFELASILTGYLDLEPGEFRKTVIALAFGLPTFFLVLSIAAILASLTLFLIVLIFAPHIGHRRALEIFPYSPDSLRKTQDKSHPGWWDRLGDHIVGTVYQRGQPG